MNKVISKIKQMDMIYVTWLVTLFFFEISQISDYFLANLNKYLLVSCILGGFLWFRHKKYRREKLIGHIIVSIVGTIIMSYMIIYNVMSHYQYYNYTLGLFIIIYANVYVAKIMDCLEEKGKINFRKLEHLWIKLATIGMFLFIILSSNMGKLEYIPIFFVYLAIVSENYTKEEKQCAWHGIIDGICLGFMYAQFYAFLFQHYAYDAYSPYAGPRYKGYMNYTTTAGIQYMLMYAMFMMKYYLYVKQGNARIKKCLCWWAAMLVLGLLYLTGSRSGVLAIILTTILGYLGLHWCLERKVKLFKIVIKTAVVGVVSLCMFPVAYGGVRYLPTIIGRPDVIDVMGCRYYSIASKIFNEPVYVYEHSISINDEWDSPKYVTLAESVYTNLGRILPKGNEILKEMGILPYLRSSGVIASINGRNAISTNQNTDNTDIVLDEASHSMIIQQEEKTESTIRGSSEDLPYYEEKITLSSSETRWALHWYTLQKLNLWGHPSGEYEMWLFPTQSFRHAHNVFLIMGYDFGIFSMLGLVVVVLGTILVNIRYVYEKKELLFLFPILFMCGILIFGMYEAMALRMSAFYYIILASAILPSVENKSKDLMIKRMDNENE